MFVVSLNAAMSRFVESVSGFHSRVDTVTKGRVEMGKSKQERVK
jgi:hypothetical protein